MNYTPVRFFTLTLLVVLIYVSPNLANAQGGTFSVSMDKPTYLVGETAVIRGTVPIVLQGAYIAIQVFNPNATPYAIDQLTPTADGTFSTTIKLGGKLGITGLYTVKATYLGNSVTASFELITEVESSIQNIKLETEDQVFDLLVSLTNGRVAKIELEPDFTSISVSMQTSGMQNGTLQITIPRELIDAKEGPGWSGGDKSFNVLVEGKESVFNEVNSTETSRTLEIPVPSRTQTVEIIGTVTIPEFEAIAVLILGMALAAIVALRYKSYKFYRNRFC